VALSFSEKKVTHAVTETLRAQLTVPALLERFQESFTRRSSRRTAARHPGSARSWRRNSRPPRPGDKNVTAALAKIGFSEALAAQLAEDEKRVADAKARLSQAGARTPKVLPHPSRIESYVRNLLAVLEADKDAARALLGRHMPPLVLTPEGSTYRITGGFDLSLCLDDQQASRPLGGPGHLRVYDRKSSGGVIHGLDIAESFSIAVRLLVT
jgi:hypothetical protein